MSAASEPEVILGEITERAGELGLHLVRGPSLVIRSGSAPQVEWQGDWTEYLEMASSVGAPAVYVETEPFDVERQNDMLLAARKSGKQEPDEEEQAWFLDRLKEATELWSSYNGELGHLRCAWFKEGVGHYFVIEASWYAEHRAAVNKALEQAEAVRREMRHVHTEETAAARLELAFDLARHERFPTATNDEKRRYMAQQLFLDLDEESAGQIASLAQVVYWWDVEPEREQKVRDLRNQGESIKNIAALLKMSEAKVKAALEATETRSTGPRSNEFDDIFN